MDAREQRITERARAVARELGLEILDVEEQAAITGAEWRAWAAMPETRRVIGWLAEGFIASTEAAEVNSVKRRHLGGARPGMGVSNDLAKKEILARQDGDLYRRLLHGIAKMANRQD